MTWEGFGFGILLCVVVFIWTLVACLAVDLHRWLWNGPKRPPGPTPPTGMVGLDEVPPPRPKRT